MKIFPNSIFCKSTKTCTSDLYTKIDWFYLKFSTLLYNLTGMSTCSVIKENISNSAQKRPVFVVSKWFFIYTMFLYTTVVASQLRVMYSIIMKTRKVQYSMIDASLTFLRAGSFFICVPIYYYRRSSFLKLLNRLVDIEIELSSIKLKITKNNFTNICFLLAIPICWTVLLNRFLQTFHPDDMTLLEQVTLIPAHMFLLFSLMQYGLITASLVDQLKVVNAALISMSFLLYNNINEFKDKLLSLRLAHQRCINLGRSFADWYSTPITICMTAAFFFTCSFYYIFVYNTWKKIEEYSFFVDFFLYGFSSFFPIFVLTTNVENFYKEVILLLL